MSIKRIIISLFTLSVVSWSYGQNFNWAQDIAPIIYENCSSCHHDGGIAPFELMKFQDVYQNAHAIEHAVLEREMPPWPADPEYMHFANEDYLSQEEIDAIVWWINNGLPTGDMNLEPDPPVFLESGSLLDTIDFTVAIEPYTLQYNQDEYRWFVIENPFEEDFYISKIEVIPGLESIVHHADLFYDITGISMQYDNLDPLPGFNGNIGGPVNSHYINAWQPGARPAEYPEGWGVKVPPNADLVVEIHYGPGGIGLIDDTKMNLQFVRNTEEVRPVLANWLLYDSPPSLIDGPLFIPANEVVTFHQESYPLTTDLSIISICPHMHFLGKSYKVWYETPDGIEHPLIDIPNWDFHWQKYYTYQYVKKIPAGAVIKSEGVYDNTSNNHDNPFDPPQDCWRGGTTLDEMFLCYFIYAIYEEGDESILMDFSLFEDFDPSSLTENELLLFPNPASNEIFLSGYIPSTENLNFRISDAQGKLVFNTSRTNTRSVWYERFDISNLETGYYIIDWSGNSIKGSTKFFKD